MLRDLRDARPPDAGAAERRAWAVTSQAFAERTAAARGPGRPPRRRGRRIGPAALVAATAVVAVVAAILAFTPPGDAVADWVRRVVDPPPAPAPPAERRVELPGAGRVLVAGETGLRIVDRDGAGRSLGRWDGGTWSPNGRYAAAWRDRELAALAPAGGRAWTIRARAPIAAARWSPEGFHVAYLLDGGALRVVAGNGLRDRAWRAGAAPVAPAFRPNARRTLAWVRADGRVLVEDVFTGARRARSGPRLGDGATALAWTADGRRLAVLNADGLRLWNVRRGSVRTLDLDGRPEALAASPRAARLAVLTHDRRRGVSTITLTGAGATPLATTRVRGHLRDLAFSPDGRTLLAGWPQSRRWLVLDAGGEALAPTPTTRAPRGTIAGWCCPT